MTPLQPMMSPPKQLLLLRRAAFFTRFLFGLPRVDALQRRVIERRDGGVEFRVPDDRGLRIRGCGAQNFRGRG